MLENSTLSELKDKKNLLAFSAGVDSTALFFLLTQHNIKFDIAIVNYGSRKQSQDEVAYAKELAKQHNSTCHLLDAQKIDTNFESNAREIRYDFFEELIKEHRYDNLLTAHHLGDRFEWMLMQFCKGAGCAELAGMKTIELRENYKLIRPLLHVDKNELLEYLNTNDIKYFEDKSNLDEGIKRNSFRHKYSNPLLKEHLDGIKKSFKYIDEDRDALIGDIKVKSIDNFAYFNNSNNVRSNIYAIDKYLKSQKYMLTSNERELLKTKETLVVGRKFVVVQNSDFVFIAPFSSQKINMTKEFKEQMRILKIEPKLRPYFYENREVFQKIKELFTAI
ncbi:MAG: tRNA lysidine(34) synthetase TilS [Sulfurimonas sp.]|uniref:tRNA lysidine(34) synthetase TilS n=1 Tax=Sulfurimonas sp. TaxID=2022749 RepID=UPI0026375593|nr:tRNA lysidine(34) synthetase TilS [Sulfurimonas sp.]MCW8895802.1 tRNA lysidine(34) synthetase TilS [Sulfurimonas sp.]MCW8954132.1 tRNA lysidine(34) synthetase TilS [Sulfurimonas sp.]MCW9068048.1 tRNA lysidine(34) synthetase TilS [Sulfurimonas sp.]